MPKLVDHEKRKKQIAEATWRVILDRGMEGATVRNIAKEAGLSLGALRHYFSTQEELLIYAMDLVKNQAEQRIYRVIDRKLPPKEMALNMLLELLPTTEETRAEMEVWFSFVAYARHRRSGVHPYEDGLFDGITRMVHSLNKAGYLRDGIDLDAEAERLYALIDGLALHALLAPDRLNQTRLSEIVGNHLDSIWQETPQKD